MKIFKNILILVLSSSLFVACEPKFDDVPAATAGSANFSVYVSIGEGTPSGYCNGALSRENQLSSTPFLLSEQFKAVGGGEFKQPLFPEGTSFGFEKGHPSTTLYLRERTFCDDSVELYSRMFDSSTFNYTPVQILGLTQSIRSGLTVAGPYNNLAANGAKTIFVNRPAPSALGSDWGTGNSEIFYEIFKSTNPAATILSEAAALNPTFFSLQLGNTDILRYSKSGGNEDGGGADDNITPVQEFEDSLRSIVSTLTANGAKGVITDIIGIESFPYYTHYKYDFLILSADSAAALTNFYAATSGYTFKEGRNALVIEDASAPFGHRRMLSDEFLLLEVPRDSLKCLGLGGRIPLGRRWVLDKGEIDTVNAAIDAYNAVIKQVATDYDLAFADGHDGFSDIIAGTYFNGKEVDASFAGGYFSLDGLNISPLAQAIAANNMISAINKKYGSTIRNVDINKYVGTSFK